MMGTQPAQILSYAPSCRGVICHRTGSGVRIEIPNVRPHFGRSPWLFFGATYLSYFVFLIAGLSSTRSFALGCTSGLMIKLVIDLLVWLLMSRGPSILELDRTGLRAWNLVGAEKAEWPLRHSLRIKVSKRRFSKRSCIKIGDGYFMRFATHYADYVDLSRAVNELNEAMAELRLRVLIADPL